jgi:hypothetical protein
MNATQEQILEIERGFWTRADDRRYYDENMVDGALSVIEPMGAVEKAQALSNLADAPWTDVDMRDVTIREVTPEVVVLAYHGTGRHARDDKPFRGSIASVYVRDGNRWRLALTSHQPWSAG